MQENALVHRLVFQFRRNRPHGDPVRAFLRYTGVRCEREDQTEEQDLCDAMPADHVLKMHGDVLLVNEQQAV